MLILRYCRKIFLIDWYVFGFVAIRAMSPTQLFCTQIIYASYSNNFGAISNFIFLEVDSPMSNLLRQQMPLDLNFLLAANLCRGNK